MPFLFDLTQITLIDLSLAVDNVLVVGMAVSALPQAKRKKAMSAGIAVATVLRIIMALFAVQLLHITGLVFAGGILLTWVAWKMMREFHYARIGRRHTDKSDPPPPKKMSAAIRQIIVADVSMSIDNALGVAGVAHDHVLELVIGLTLSVVFMAFASLQIAKVTERHPRVVLVGVAVVLYTALSMIYEGGQTLGWWHFYNAAATHALV